MFPKVKNVNVESLKKSSKLLDFWVARRSDESARRRDKESKRQREEESRSQREEETE